MARIQSTLKVNIVASITRTPHESTKLISSSAGLIKADDLSATSDRCYLGYLLDRAFGASTAVESSIKGTRIGRTAVVVGEIDDLENTTLVGLIGRGGHLAVEGACLADKGSGSEEERELHFEEWRLDWTVDILKRS